MRLVVFTCLFALLCALPSSASAAFFVAEPIDGPSADIRSFEDVDIAQDGTGGLVYIKNEAGVPHVFLSRKVDGAWRAPERVDLGVETAATAAAIAAGDDHRLAIVFVSGGRLFGSVASGGPPVALPAPVLLYADPDPLRAVTSPTIDLGINGTAYAVFAAPGAGGRDVRAARLDGTTWAPVPQPLDIDINARAGDGAAGRPRVGVSAEGNAVAIWGESNKVFARRLTGVNLSVAPQEVSLATFEGQTGGAADSPDLQIEDDGSYAWATWRQDFNGVSRTLSRRLVGSQFEPAVNVGGIPSANPRIDMNGRGTGLAVSGVLGSNAITGAFLVFDAFKPFERFDVGGGGSGLPSPVVGFAEREHALIAWKRDGAVVARYKPPSQPFEPEFVVSNPTFGGVPATGKVVVSSSRVGDFAIGFQQSDRIVVAEYDRLPGTPAGSTSTNWQRRTVPRLKWREGLNLWGPQTFRVLIDGQEVASTPRDTAQPGTPLSDGSYSWRVVAVDRRGQQTASKPRLLRIDATPPEGRIRVTGTRKRGRSLLIRVSATDQGGSKVKRVTIGFGDNTARVTSNTARHTYRAAGTYKVTARITDRAGNVTPVESSIRIKR